VNPTFIIILFWIQLQVCAYAQTYVVDNWQIEQGLPSNSIINIAQSSDGYLWVGTNGGLARFDGLKFNVSDIANTGVLTSNRITSVSEDKSKRLWLGTYGGGLCYLDKGKFFRFDLEPYTSNYISTGIVYQLRNEVIITTAYDGFLTFKNNKLTHFKKYQNLSLGDLLGITKESDTSLILNMHYHLLRYTNGVLSISPLQQLLPPNTAYIHHIDVIPGSQTIIGIISLTNRKGNYLFLIQNNQFILSKKSFDINQATIDIDHNNQLYLRNYKSVYKLDIAGNEFVINKLIDANEYGMKFITDFFVDREQNYWIGTTEQGLFRLKHNPFSTIDFQEGVIQNSVITVAKDETGNIWWATPTYQLNKLKKDGTVVRVPVQNVNYWTILPNADSVLLGGAVNGIEVLKTSGSYAIPYPINGWTHALMFYGSNLLCGSYQHFYVYRNGKWLTQSEINKKLDSKRITRFYIDRNDNLWILAELGIYKADTAFNIQTIYEPVDKAVHARCIFEYQDAFLIGTYGNGLIVIKDNRIQTLNSTNGLVDNTISEILQIKNRFWLAGNKGLSAADVSDMNQILLGKSTELKTVLYDRSDGLKVSEFNGGTQTNKVHMHDNVFAFTSMNGLNVVDFDKIESNKVIPQIVIERIVANDSLINHYEPFSIKYDNNRVEVEFTSLSLVSAKNNRFKYMLDGYDMDWKSAGTERKVTYTNLPPGMYLFKVIGSNNTGIWNEQGASISFYIIPPFYMTTWFRVLIVILLLTSLIFITFITIKIIQRKEKERILINEIEQKARFNAIMDTEERERKRIAEDIHDGIGPLLSTVKLNLSLAERKHADENLITAKAQLDSITNELRNITYNLIPSTLHAFGLNVAIKEFVEKQFSGLPIKTYFDEAGTIMLPIYHQTVLYRVIQEIIHNIIKHSNCTEIRIHLVNDSDEITIMIEDNGIGFDVAESLLKKQSRGLKNIQERCKAINAQLIVDSSIGNGATFIITLQSTQT
jgi:signal transduction histidine kinase/ligand-binding sensor domain-containing protein